MVFGGTSRWPEGEPDYRGGKMPSRSCGEIVRLTGPNDIRNMQYQLGLGTASRSQQDIICRFQRNCTTRLLPQKVLKLPQKLPQNQVDAEGTTEVKSNKLFIYRRLGESG
jgi:hypothetical protein